MTFKRCFDILFVLIGLTALAPLLVAIAAGVFITLGPPILFQQTRVGINGRLFKIYKFRTLRIAHKFDGQLLPDSVRRSSFGDFLRYNSLDELPQLFNILWGDMSFVGPRPQVPENLIGIRPKYLRRHLVLPGLTGWAQVNGRNALDWETRFEYDLWYVDNWSIGLDLRIIRLTFPLVLRQVGIDPVNSHTNEFPPAPLQRRKSVKDPHSKRQSKRRQ